MRTIGEALDLADQQLFVGRRDEIDAFSGWLREEPPFPAIWNVVGTGGTGKSALLRAFRRVAQDAGLRVIFVDGAAISATRDDLLRALGGDSPETAVARVNERPSLLMIDSFGALSQLSSFLQEEVLDRLDARTRVVIATRFPLRAAWGIRSPWTKMMRTIKLRGLELPERREYLERRGITDERLVEQILDAVGGLPLGLCLSADMVIELGIRDLSAAPEWHLVLQTLIEQMLEGLEDPALREVLDACAVVRQFDEQLLADVTGNEDVRPAFDRLCRLSFVNPAEHGLMLHEDVSRILADNLRWRDAPRYETLRARALEHYRKRAQDAPSGERARLISERLYLWRNALVQKLFFMQDVPGRVWIDDGRPEDHDAILDIWFQWLDAIPTPEPAAPGELEVEREWVRRYLSNPGLWLRVFRDLDGEVTGFLSIMRVYAGSVDLLLEHPYRGQVVRAYLEHEDPMLAATPDAARLSYLFQLSTSDREREATYAAILRESVGYFARGGVLLAAPIPETHRALTAALGFRQLPNSESAFRGLPFQGIVLDLDRIGVETWIQAVVTGKKLPEPLSDAEFERELQNVLLQFDDDTALVTSPLAAFTESSVDAPNEVTAQAMRDVIRLALEKAEAASSENDVLALRAIRLAYVERVARHERVAERLTVSRSTFYRLLKRGTTLLANELQPR